jgi:hypothetical protein
MMVKSPILKIFLKIQQAPSELLLARPIQPVLQNVLHWAAALLEGLVRFQNKNIYTTFHYR